MNVNGNSRPHNGLERLQSIAKKIDSKDRRRPHIQTKWTDCRLGAMQRGTVVISDGFHRLGAKYRNGLVCACP